jgi:hypothetical protein
LLKAYDLRPVQVQFPLHPDTPPGGITIAELVAGRGYDLEAMHARMKSLMDAEGLPYARRERTYNSRLAQELGKWGEAAGRPQIHDALYRAYFVDGVDIAVSRRWWASPRARACPPTRRGASFASANFPRRSIAIGRTRAPSGSPAFPPSSPAAA